jgi:hypothetical protein
MNSTGVGGRGGVRNVMLVSSSRRSPFRWLHGAHEVTTFSTRTCRRASADDVVEREPVALGAAIDALPAVAREEDAARDALGDATRHADVRHEPKHRAT